MKELDLKTRKTMRELGVVCRHVNVVAGPRQGKTCDTSVSQVDTTTGTMYCGNHANHVANRHHNRRTA